MSTNEPLLKFELISKHVEKQKQAAEIGIKELQVELIETMGSTTLVSEYLLILEKQKSNWLNSV